MSVFAEFPISIRIAIALGIAGSAWCSGANLCCSYIVAGSLAADPLPPSVSPQTIARIWQGIYNRGAKMINPVILPAGLAWAYAAYSIPNLPNDPLLRQDTVQHMRWVFGICGVLILSILPYWLIVMAPTVNALNERAVAGPGKRIEPQVVGESDETRKLIIKWARLNVVKGVVSLVVTGIGLSVVLS